MGAVSAYSAWLLYRVFLGTDSDRFPVNNYGDLMAGLVGPRFGYLVHVFQALQLVLGVAYLVLRHGQSISHISEPTPGKNGLCFIVCVFIFTVMGMVVGRIRTLQRFACVANFSVVVQTLSCIMMWVETISS